MNGGFKFLQGQINKQAIGGFKSGNGGHNRVKSCVLDQNKASAGAADLLNDSVLNKTTTELVTSQAVIAEEEVEEEKPVVKNTMEIKTFNNTSGFHT